MVSCVVTSLARIAQRRAEDGDQPASAAGEGGVADGVGAAVHDFAARIAVNSPRT
jgi:hypothetical protein